MLLFVKIFRSSYGQNFLPVALGCTLLILTVPAHASLWDILQEDLDAVQLSQQTDAAQDALLRVEALREGGKDLLPAFPAQVKGLLAQRIDGDIAARE